MTALTEEKIESIARDAFAQLGFAVSAFWGVDREGVEPRADIRGAVLVERLTEAVRRINHTFPQAIVPEVVRRVLAPPHADLRQNNRWFHALLTDGVEVEYRDSATG